MDDGVTKYSLEYVRQFVNKTISKENSEELKLIGQRIKDVFTF